MTHIADPIGNSAPQWQAVFERLKVVHAPLRRALADTADAEPRNPAAPQAVNGQRAVFEFRRMPLQLYLQSSSSALFGARTVTTTMEPGFRSLVATSMGLSLRHELTGPPRVPAPTPAPAEPGVRTCAGIIQLNMHIGHPRYAAMLRAQGRKTAARDQDSYTCFTPRFQALCDGQLSEAEAAHLADDWVQRTLKLSECEHIEMDARVHRAMQLRDDRPVLRVADIAGELGLSASRLSHLFSEYTGFSFRQYLLIARTLYAWDQVVQQPERSLTDIAHTLGFSDLAHMSRAFQLLFSCSPRHFRDAATWRIHGAPAPAGLRIPPRWTPASATTGNN